MHDLTLLVTCDFFSLYGLERPVQGRLFGAADCAPNQTSPDIAPVIIGEELWRSRFFGNAGIIGSRIRLNRRPFQVVGVAPARFAGRLRGPGIWIPYTSASPFFAGRDLFQEPDVPWLIVEGRLRPGFSRADAEREINAIGTNHQHVVLTNGSFAQHPDARAQMLFVMPLVMGALTLVLLLACANVTTLLMSRAASRRQEIVIRRALGADRARLVRMLLTEGVLLSGTAGGLSAILAYWIPAAFERVMWRAPHYPVQPDWVIFAYLAGVTLLAGCIAGLGPAAESFRSDLTPSLKKEPRFARISGVQLASLVAMSLVLLTGAALFVRARFTALHGAGFEAQSLVMHLANRPSPELEQRIRSLPGVEATGFATLAPFADKGEDEVLVNSVSPGFFDALRIPIMRGRGFQPGDASAVVITEALERQLWPNHDALGKTYNDKTHAGATVIGVARDADYIRFGAGERLLYYRLLAGNAPGASMFIRFHGDAITVARSVGAVAAQLDPEQTGLPSTLQSQMEEMGSRFSTISGMVACLGAIALLLAMVGVFGLASFTVSQRSRELAIRVSLGARRKDIVRCVLAPGIKPVLIGLLAGTVLTFAGAGVLWRVFRSTPVAFTVFDPAVYAGVSLLLIGVALLAMFPPALRAAAADPGMALRQE